MYSAPGTIKKAFFPLLLLSTQYLSAHEGDRFFISPQMRLPLLLGSVFIVLVIILLTSMATLLKRRNRNYKLLSNANETILICDPEGNIKECITELTCAENLKEIFGDNNVWEINQALKSVCRMDADRIIKLVISYQEDNGGDCFSQIVMQNMLSSKEIKGISVIIEDITESKLLENRLIRSREMAFHEARHDPLTSIPNRLYFNEAVKKRFARLERHSDETLCLLMLDLDHFKDVNDNWGHDVGDEVLIKLTEICSELIRASDVFARFGGEEFICYLDDLPENAGLDVAERMRQSVEEYKDWPKGVHLTTSIGLAEYNGDIRPEDLIKKADIALYNAKAMGRNRVSVYLATED
ncbi:MULTISPECIES: GGDEF domain-containing protein [unclassified Oceanispirochaeta]|uniref:sensor domain-containing diguanylate cyclase n=1 Tax=unclassified Oceanispirochaeta TaxID=2635722 RepID=UPI000E096F6C|nr:MULTISPECIES: GGDEF domain-containing protein [unclassified Oceanispirochaeta]MBF9016447.1 GGDEF domain-containing protein [Oceanispirochaeta sp. M2]NPD72909.1 diguanylate cyclase [Oceanispirochaeta sp. M1]RDG31486.1 diguanylate cyclase [Oceanispirochaeta sp. M1]